MVELSFLVFPNLKDYRKDHLPSRWRGVERGNPSASRRNGVIRMKENLLRFLEADSAPWIPPETLARSLIEPKSHEGITVIP